MTPRRDIHVYNRGRALAGQERGQHSFPESCPTFVTAEGISDDST
jgi:hypothetical protein